MRSMKDPLSDRKDTWIIQDEVVGSLTKERGSDEQNKPRQWRQQAVK